MTTRARVFGLFPVFWLAVVAASTLALISGPGIATTLALLGTGDRALPVSEAPTS